MSSSIISTNAQKVLVFLIQDPGRQFLANEIQKATKVSRAGVNFSLRKLTGEKLILREKKAKIFLYSVDHNNPVIKQSKVLNTVMLLEPVINKLKAFSQKIVLFGSCSRGDNAADSDIDIFILSNSPDVIEEKIKKNKLGKKIQAIIRNSTQFIKMEKEEPIFWAEIDRGIILWESKDESRI